MILLLTACADDAQRYEFAMPLTGGGRLCVIQCQQAQEFCGKQCNLGQNECIQKMQLRAIHAFNTYAAERFRQSLPVERQPYQFEQPDACMADQTCINDCASTYRGCYSGCGGQVIPAN
jgi:hypothetical protein